MGKNTNRSTNNTRSNSRSRERNNPTRNKNQESDNRTKPGNPKESRPNMYCPANEKQGVDYFKSETNDWRWYANDVQLLKDVASMPYGYSLGGLIDFGPGATQLSNRSIPGAMSINFVPTVGWSEDNESAVNVAMKNMVTYMKATVSGARTYDSPDLCMYLMAIDSANMFLAWMRRLYGITGLANMVNRYYPEALLHANSTDYGIIRANMADFRAYINMYATKLGGYVLPSFMPICARHMWLCNGYYLDGASGKNQIYITVPEGFHRFVLDGDGAGKLEFDRFIGDNLNAHHYLTISEIMEFGDSLLNNIRNSYGEQDFNQIAADLLATYGESNVYRPEGITDSYVVGPTYDPVVLGQFKNATAYGLNKETGTYDITQDATKNFVVCKPFHAYDVGRRDVAIFQRNRLIMAEMPNPGPETTMENTRLTCIPRIEVNDTTHKNIAYFDTVGSELCTRYFIYQYLPDSTGTGIYLSRSYEIQSTAEIILYPMEGDPEQGYIESRDAVFDELTTLGLLSNFDWHPSIVVNVSAVNAQGDPDANLPPIQGRQIFADVNNYTIINREDLKRINHVALLSEFAVEKFGRGMIK